MNLIKSPSAAGAVTAASFAASATHIFSVVTETNSPFVSWVYPIGIDGLIFVGLRAMQTGRKAVGTVALLIGAVYSLLFNGHAEGALTMPPGLIAASMPICFFAAVLIETTAPKAVEEIPAPAAAPVAAPAPIVVPATVAAPAPAANVVAVASRHGGTNFVKVDAPKAVEGPKASGGRVASWDVEKAVRLLADGRTDADVLSLVDGLTAKPLQRTKRAVKIITADASTTDAEIASTVGQSVAHIGRVRAAMIQKENA